MVDYGVMARNSQVGYPIIVDELCVLCQRCTAMKVCKGMAIRRFDQDEAPFVDVSQCMQCWTCLDNCQNEAIVRVLQG